MQRRRGRTVAAVILAAAMAVPVIASPVTVHAEYTEPSDIQVIRPYITGMETVGTTLKGEYHYYDVDKQHAESGSTFRWLRSDTKNGEYTPIDGATGLEYTLTDADAGKYIRFEVTPASGGQTGTTAQSRMIGPVMTEEQYSQVHNYFDNDNDYMANVGTIQDELAQRLENAVYFTVDSGNLYGSEVLYQNNIKKEWDEGTKPIVQDETVYAPEGFFTTYLEEDVPDVDTVEADGEVYYDLKAAVRDLGKEYWSGDENQSELENFQMEHLGQGLVVISDTKDIFQPVQDRDLINEACNMLYTLRATEEQMEWFRDAKFGMFLHWDMSSVSGVEISWDRQAFRPNDIGSGSYNAIDEEYDTLYQEFNPVNYDPDEWMQLAKDAGMKYVVLTAKHHGGFSNFFSDYDSYTIENTPYGEDIVKQYVEAAHKAGLKVGFYYSARDWYNPNYLTEDHHRYLEYYFGQIQELLSNYGTIDVMWFDSIGSSSLNQWDPRTLLRRMKQISPNLIINNRYVSVLGNYEKAPYDINGDWYTPEGRLSGFDSTRPWESCICVAPGPNGIGGGWSYRPDYPTNSVEDSIQYLINNTVNDGNLLYNIGPKPDGTLDEEQSDVFRQVGDWLEVYGEAVYNTRGGPYQNPQWGGSTYKVNEDSSETIYLHVSPLLRDYTPADNTLQIEEPSNGQVYASASLLKDGTEVGLVRNENGYLITLPEGVEWDEWDTVIELSPDIKATLENKVAEAQEYAETMTDEALADAKAQLLEAVEEAKAVLEGDDQDSFSSQLQKLSEARERAEAAGELNEMIDSAAQKLDSVSVGENPWECSQSSYDQIAQAIESGRTLLQRADSSAADLEKAASNLEVLIESLNEIMNGMQIQFTPDQSKVDAGTSVSMTSPYEELSIHYTVDGTTPTADSPVYTGENITVSGSALAVKAILVDQAGNQVGDVQEQTYLIPGSLDNIAPEYSSVSASTEITHASGYTGDLAVDGNTGTRWATPDGTITAVLELSFDQEQTVNAMMIEEYLDSGETTRISDYAVEYLDKETGLWETAYEGGGCGASQAAIFEPVTSDRFRLNIYSCMNVTIWEFSLFNMTDSISVSADKTTIMPGEEMHLSVSGTDASGSQIPEEDLANITYYTDREDLISISEDGIVTVNQGVSGTYDMNVWATAEVDGAVLTSDTLRLRLDVRSENLALGASVTASGTYSDFTADKTIDEDPHTRWATTKSEDGVYWLEYDFGEEKTFDMIDFQVYSDKSDPAGFEVYKDFQLQYEKDGEWVNFYDSVSASPDITYPVYNGTESYDGIVWVDSDGNVKQTEYKTYFEPVTAQKIRFYSANTEKDPSIIEFGVYQTLTEEPEYGENLALGRTTSGPAIGGYETEKAVDGDRSTRWATNSGEAEYAFEVDFGEEVTFDTVCFDVYSDKSDPERFELYNDFQIQVEKDGQWVDVFDSASGEEQIRYPRYDGTESYEGVVWTDSRGNAKSTDYTVTFEPVTAGKMRLYSDNVQKGPSLLELEVYSTKEAVLPDITAVNPIDGITVENGTAFTEIGLPETVTVTLNDGTTAEVPVTWSEEGYDGSAAGEYVLTGVLTVDETMTNSQGLTASVTVTVKEEPENPGGDKQKLEELYNRMKDETASGYIKDTWEIFQKALAQAESVLSDAEADQEAIDKAYADLQSAIDGLRVSKTTLEYFLNSAKEHVANGDTEGLVESVQKLFEEAIAEGEAVLADENATKEEVTNATIKLMKAIQALDFKAGDKTDLEMALDLAETIDLTKYVEEGQAEYLEAKETAESVMEDGDAMRDEVNAAWNALVDAMNNLRLKANKDALQDLLNSLEGLDLSLYTEESVQVYNSAFAKASAVLADATLSVDDQDEVDAAVKALADAKEQLVLKEENQGGSGDGNTETPGGDNSGNNGQEQGSGNTDNAGSDNRDSGTAGGNSVNKAAKTGDNMNPAVWAALLGVAAVIAGAVSVKKRKQVK